MPALVLILACGALADAKGYAARLDLEFHHRYGGLDGLAAPLSLAAEGEVAWRS